MKVYYVRHGESEANVAGVVAGSETDAILTDNGRKQARRAGQDLKDKNIDLVVCSPLSRTFETAKLIAEEIGYSTSGIIKSEFFIERAVGIFAGKPHKYYAKAVLISDKHEGLESRKEVYQRVERGFKWLKKQNAQNVILVSHGGTGRAVRAVVHGLHHEEMYKVDGFANTEIFEFEL